jgi:hypothetical protein
VDPTDVTSELSGSAAYASTSAFELTAITGIRPFVGNTAGGFPGVSANFDEIRLGDTWASVVPEPTSAAIAGLGLIGWMLSSRRQKSC